MRKHAKETVNEEEEGWEAESKEEMRGCPAVSPSVSQSCEDDESNSLLANPCMPSWAASARADTEEEEEGDEEEENEEEDAGADDDDEEEEE